MQTFKLGKKRAVYFDVTDYTDKPAYGLSGQDKTRFEKLDVLYRALVSVMYTCVPTSGHPGGSISSGRIVSHLIYKDLAYELADPRRSDADILSYAAGHKALGLYALWALRDECARLAAPGLLPKEDKQRLRLEDLLGFRRNKAQGTPLFTQFHSKTLGGHPEPLVPFVKTSTGASGVGDGSAVGLALAAADAYGKNCPRVHILEGEGGLTAGRVSEAVATASTAQLKNAVFHIDWNESSIESDRVTSDGENPGDYVQWNPMEFFYMHDCNVIRVPDGHNFEQIHAAQKLAAEIDNHQPTAIVYRTVKGWKYGMEGKAAHGSGYKFASDGFYDTLKECEAAFGVSFPRFEGEKTPQNIERFYWDCLLTVRRALEKEPELCQWACGCVEQAGEKLSAAQRTVREGLGDCQDLYTQFDPLNPPEEFKFAVGETYTTRGVLGNVLGYLNRACGGTLLTASADLYGSTNAGNISKGFAGGFFNTVSNPLSRSLSAGGICEDGMSAVCAGISSFGKHIGVSASYAAFLAFEHVAARLHAIGCQAAREAGEHPNTFIMFNGHAGLPTGEDGPTHADPQSLQLMQDNFPKGACITVTPMEVDEIWPLVTRALQLRPAVFSPFVVRTGDKFMDRVALDADPAAAAVNGVYYLMRAKNSAATVFVQGAGVGKIFVNEVLPEIKKSGLDVNVIYVASRELFELLPEEQQLRLVPVALRRAATGVTDFTPPTMQCWLESESGRKHMLYPHKKCGYLGSGGAHKVYEEAGLDGKTVFNAVRDYVADLNRGDWN